LVLIALCRVHQRRRLGDGAGARGAGGDELVGGKIGCVLPDRVGGHDVELVQVGKRAGGRPAVDDHHRTALDEGSGDRVDHADRADAVGDRGRAQPLGARVAVGRVARFEIARRDDRAHALPDRRVEQRRAVGGGHGEQGVDLLLGEAPDDVIGDCESHEPISCSSCPAKAVRRVS
jgi:hypothetical protein